VGRCVAGGALVLCGVACFGAPWCFFFGFRVWRFPGLFFVLFFCRRMMGPPFAFQAASALVGIPFGSFSYFSLTFPPRRPGAASAYVSLSPVWARDVIFFKGGLAYSQLATEAPLDVTPLHYTTDYVLSFALIWTLPSPYSLPPQVTPLSALDGSILI